VLKIDLIDTCLFIPAYKAGLSRQDFGKKKNALIKTGALVRQLLVKNKAWLT